MARPTEYNFELAEEICELVANGMHVVVALESKDVYPSWSTFRRWKFQNEELQTLYINAIRDKSEMVILGIDDTMNELKKGEMDASTANVIIQTLKWKAAKFYPKMFGDRTQLEVPGAKEITISFKD